MKKQQIFKECKYKNGVTLHLTGRKITIQNFSSHVTIFEANKEKIHLRLYKNGDIDITDNVCKTKHIGKWF